MLTVRREQFRYMKNKYLTRFLCLTLMSGMVLSGPASVLAAEDTAAYTADGSDFSDSGDFDSGSEDPAPADPTPADANTCAGRSDTCNDPTTCTGRSDHQQIRHQHLQSQHLHRQIRLRHQQILLRHLRILHQHRLHRLRRQPRM